LTSQVSPTTLIGALSGSSGLLAQLNTDIQGLPAAAQSAIAMAPGFLQTLITQSGQAGQNQFANATDAFNTAATAAEGALSDTLATLDNVVGNAVVPANGQLSGAANFTVTIGT